MLTKEWRGIVAEKRELVHLRDIGPQRNDHDLAGVLSRLVRTKKLPPTSRCRWRSRQKIVLIILNSSITLRSITLIMNFGFDSFLSPAATSMEKSESQIRSQARSRGDKVARKILASFASVAHSESNDRGCFWNTASDSSTCTSTQDTLSISSYSDSSYFGEEGETLKSPTDAIRNMMQTLQDETDSILSMPIPNPGVDKSIPSETPIESILPSPQIMLHVYSYLPIHDRVFSLGLVNKTLCKDKIRGGIVRPVYGHKELSITEVLGDVVSWKRQQRKSSFFWDRQRRRKSFLKLAQMYEAIGRHDASQQIQKYLKGKVNTLPFIEIAGFADTSETLSRLKSFLKDVFKNRVQDGAKAGAARPHWMEDFVAGRWIVNDYLYGTEVNQLGRLVDEILCQDEDHELYDDIVQYIRSPRGRFHREPPAFDARVTLLLLDSNGTWASHKFSMCQQCSHFRQEFKTVICNRHCEQKLVCIDCYNRIIAPRRTYMTPTCQVTTRKEEAACAFSNLPRTTLFCADCRVERLRHVQEKPPRYARARTEPIW